MTGGGFGGSIIALIAEERCDAAVKAVTITFRQHGFVAPSAFTARPSRGGPPGWLIGDRVRGHDGVAPSG